MNCHDSFRVVRSNFELCGELYGVVLTLPNRLRLITMSSTLSGTMKTQLEEIIYFGIPCDSGGPAR